MARHGRAALLRLASWFDAADSASAHEIYTAAFGAHGGHHLGGGVVDDSVHATTSWWDAPTAVLPSGPRSAVPAAAVADYGDQQARLRDAAEAAAHWRRSAAREVRRLLSEPTGDDSRVDLSAAAMEVLMELLTAALGSGDTGAGPVSAGDLELDVRLHVSRDPDARLTLSRSAGALVLAELRLRATGYAETDAGGARGPATDADDPGPGHGAARTPDDSDDPDEFANAATPPAGFAAPGGTPGTGGRHSQSGRSHAATRLVRNG
ncbi:uncharacterized protein DUF2397 [Murinocardiopsis flavida]|uniref:Uncharacterized protein DUF2397 n=1 Tax=Murinocardiopsis flavida TaxID=645275 RepID=A0A2P8D6M2_9ACTN|nr:uncharacterized protein DUF2397 [Murinocardiopsis flavida]